MIRRSAKKAYTAFHLLFSLVGPSWAVADFRALKPGFETGEIKVQSGIFTSELAAVRIDPKLWRLSVYHSAEPITAAEACARSTSYAAINANFFGKDLLPLGLIIAESKVKHQVQLGGRTLTGIFFKQGEEYKIVFRDKLTVSLEVQEAIQAGPRLITDGESISIPQDSPTRRSAVAIDRKGRVLLFASKDRFPGLSLVEFQKILMGKDLDIKDALNLDGGGSSQLFVNAEDADRKINVSGGDKVPVFLTVHKSE